MSPFRLNKSDTISWFLTKAVYFLPAKAYNLKKPKLIKATIKKDYSAATEGISTFSTFTAENLNSGILP